MQYSHMKLLRKMIDEKVEQSKVMEYFKKEGYPEQEISSEITSYSQEKMMSRLAKAKPGEKIEEFTPVLKNEDRLKLHRMKQEGKNEEVIVKFFKILGYEENDIRKELLLGHLNPPEEPEKGEDTGTKIQPLLKKEKERPPLLIIMGVLFGIALLLTGYYIFGGDIKEFQGTLGKEPVFKVGVNVVSCSPNSVELEVTNPNTVSLPQIKFSVQGEGGCDKPISLQGYYGKQKTVCEGTYEDGIVYTLISNRTEPSGFRCFINSNETIPIVNESVRTDMNNTNQTIITSANETVNVST